ncbi:MAG: hypothetical protein AAFW76_06335, partial [Pseudomonadota bacterium]
MKQFIALFAALLAVPYAAGAQETVLSERSDTTRTGNWYVTNRSAEQIGDVVDDLKARIVDLDIVSTNPMRFDASLVANKGPHASGWWWLFGQTEAQLNAFLDDKDARIIDLETYRVGNRRLFAAVMKPNKGANEIRWAWRFGMSRDGMVNFYKDNDLRLVDIERYREDGRTRYAAVMVDNTGPRKTGWFWFRNQTLDDVVQNMR